MSEPGSFADFQQDPSRECLAALADRIMPGSRPRIVEHFNGGVRCGVHAVDLIAQSEDSLELVLKRFAAEFIWEDHAAFDCERRLLEILPRSEVSAPRLIWVDACGAIFGASTLVMTRLPGTPLMKVQARQPSTDTSGATSGSSTRPDPTDADDGRGSHVLADYGSRHNQSRDACNAGE
jgi:hypothetical protein